MKDTLELLKEVIKRVWNLVRKTSKTPDGMGVLGINGRFIDFNVSGVTVGWRVYESGGDEVRGAVGRAILKNPAWDMSVEIMMRNVLGGREARIKSISSRLLKMGQRRGTMRRGTKTEVARELISSVQGEYELAYRVPGKGGFKTKMFESEKERKDFVDKMTKKEGDDVEFRYRNPVTAGVGTPEAVQSLRRCSETLHGEMRKYGSTSHRATTGMREAGVLRQVAT